VRLSALSTLQILGLTRAVLSVHKPSCLGVLQYNTVYMQVARPGGAIAPDVSPAAVVSSVVVGITTTIILFCSHFHQIADDKAASKMSPLVRLGTANAVKVTQL
jgi:1,4-dihydroxy-2-naphthoate octaprenyltransferase